MDGTFKSTPKNYYQLFNIIAYIEQEKFYIPIAYILMKNKSFELYFKLLKEIKFHVKINNINVDFKNINFICDLERSLIKPIKEVFNKSRINGCYFHYVKALWKKMKSYGLTTKNMIDKSKIIIFGCKIFPFILNKEKKNYINDLFEFAKKSNSNYEKFIKYFKRSWLNSNFLNFDEICDGEIYNRTNYICESFNHKINIAVGYPHSKLGVLIEKLKEITINYYQSYINKLFNNNLNQINSINLFNDIKNFLEKFLKKYNNNISINLIIQEEGELKIDFESITLNVLKELYNFNIQFLNDDELKNSEENNKI